MVSKNEELAIQNLMEVASFTSEKSHDNEMIENYFNN